MKCPQQVALIARRSVVAHACRQPGDWIPPLTFPLMLMAVNSNGLKRGNAPARVPDELVPRVLRAVLVPAGSALRIGIAGVDLARDIDTGFLNRLALTPVRGAALLIGEIGGAVGSDDPSDRVPHRGLLAGVHIETGVAGAFVLLLLAVLIAAGWGTLGLWLALRTGSSEGVQSQFPLLFFATFISSMNLPRNLIEVKWFRDVATINPVSYMIEGLRTLVIGGWDVQALVLGFGFTLALIAVSLGLAGRQLKVRMART